MAGRRGSGGGILSGLPTTLLLVTVLTVVALAGVLVTSMLLYRVALDEQTARLADLAANQAELIESVARYDTAAGPMPGFGSARAATLAQLEVAFARSPGLGESGELVVARDAGSHIEIMLSLGGNGTSADGSLPWVAPGAEALKRALGGEYGTLRGTDYRGAEVVAAYRPLPALEAGLVAKIDLAEVRAPFVAAAAVALAVVAVLVVGGAGLYLRIVGPLVEARVASEQRLRAVLENLADAQLVLDEDGAIVYANRSAVALFGRDRGSLVGLRFGELAAAGDFCNIDVKPVAGSPRTAEVRAVSVEWGGRRAQVLSLRDVTERERVAAELHRHHELLQNVLDNIPAMVSWKDGELVYRGANRQFAHLSGHAAPDELVGKTDAELPWTPEETARKQRRDREVMATGTAHQGTEEGLHLYDGSSITVVTSEAPLRDPAGRVSGVLVVEVDVTALKETEHQLHQAQKMESLGKLTGGVAHDFNNLLGVILGNLQLLENALEDAPEPITRRLATAMGAVGRGAELTRRLLAFSRRQVLEPRLLDLNQLVADMDGLLERSLGETVSVRRFPATPLWPVLLDPSQAENALLNLAINARDAMARGGTLTIETANVSLDAAYARQHSYVAPGDYVELAVSDTGCGMSEAVRARVFEPFYTTKEVGKGTGLGLSMVYGFVKQSGGHVHVYSEEGLGTTVKLYFPRQGGEVAADPGTAVVGEPRGGGETLLVVEDDDTLRGLVGDYLRSLGYRVLEAASGGEALALFESEPGVDLVFTDVVMPGGMDGTELGDRLHAARPGLPVLFTSGYAGEALAIIHRRELAGALVRKPYPLEELAHRVREQLDG